MALLSNFDIKEICEFLDIPLVGVFMKDQLPKDKPIGYYVINLESSTDGNGGSHWVCLCNIPDRRYYYDSYAVGPPQLVEKFMGNHKYYINDTRLQSSLSVFCGWYCIAIAYHTYYSNGKNIESRIKSFNKMFSQKDFKKNYDKMTDYFDKLFKKHS
jgi:hypothetical protein